MPHRTSLVSLALLVVVVISAAVAVGTTTPAQDDRDAIPPEEGAAHGVDDITFWKLWSNDRDDPDSIDENDFDHQSIDDPRAAREASKGTDFLFERPPEAVRQWNDGDIGDFSPGGDHAAKVVGAANTESENGDGVDIEDAYVAVFSIDPSTVVHMPGREKRYVTGDPTLRAISDFRYETDDSESFDDSKYVEKYENPSTSATVRVKKDGSVVDSWTTGGSVGTLSHDYSVSGSADLSVEVEYKITVDHRKWECDDWNVTEDDCEGTYDKYHDEEHTVTETVSDGDTVTEHGEPTVEVTKYEYDGSDRGVVVVEPDGPWKTIDLGNVTIESQWEFYTRSPEGWETMETRDGSGTSPTQSDVRPVEVHAYPVRSNTQLEAPNDIQVLNRSTDTDVGPVSLGEDISTADPAERTPVNKVVLGSNEMSQHTIDPSSVTGLAEDVENTSLSITSTNEVKQTRIDVVSRSEESGGTHYQLQVVDGSGTPVTDGELAVNGTRYALDGSPIEVVLTGSAFDNARARYVPPESGWKTGDLDKFQRSVETLYPDTNSGIPTPFQMLQLAVYTLVWFVPLALAGVALDYVLGIRLFRDAVPNVHDVVRGVRDAIFNE